ncbi:MAG: efflux RND transporter periplasmic adaptor subunit [Pseudomonadales bacterium]|nr:efflux RND transporter periplasmic adaptor subunit [Pseudomonadales bacterium]
MISPKKIIGSIVTLLALVFIMAQMAGLFVTRIPGELMPLADSTEVMKVQTVALTSVTEVVDLAGTIQTETEVSIAALVTARIESISVRAGDQVQQGSLLIRLEDDEFKTSLAQAEKQLAGFQAQLVEAAANYDRIQSLFQKQVIARSVYDQAKANRAALQSNVDQADQAVKQAQINLSYTQIRAPVAAQIIQRLAEPGDTARVGMPLLKLFNPRRMQFATQVPESMIKHVTLGLQMVVYLETLDQAIDAVVQEIIPMADPGSRSFLVRLEIAAKEDIYPGMFARLKVPMVNVQRIYVPEQAVTQVGQMASMQVVVDGQSLRRYIRTGTKTSDYKVEVLSGLRSGEQYLIGQ